MKFTSSYYLVLTLLILVTCVKAKLWETIFKLDARTAVAENRLLTTITEIGKEWKITFEFRATSFLQNKVTNFLWLRSSQGFTLVNVGISKTKEIGFLGRIARHEDFDDIVYFLETQNMVRKYFIIKI